LLLSCFKKNFSQNKLYYLILLENKEYGSKWQNLSYTLKYFFNEKNQEKR